ncbi:MAG TPA: PQQ-binding-like beta-propeller repeat protein, partial [Ktedonobacterales bacterium]|nr:PQQ-binding-like beta-propeller repeat protein [Ktedonobacterales bacterium]
GHVLAALTVTPGVVIAVAGHSVLAYNAATGAQIWSYIDTTSGAIFFGAVAVSNGWLYVGNLDGNFYAFSIGATAVRRPAAPTQHAGKAPLTQRSSKASLAQRDAMLLALRGRVPFLQHNDKLPAYLT